MTVVTRLVATEAWSDRYIASPHQYQATAAGAPGVREPTAHNSSDWPRRQQPVLDTRESELWRGESHESVAQGQPIKTPTVIQTMERRAPLQSDPLCHTELVLEDVSHITKVDEI